MSHKSTNIIDKIRIWLIVFYDLVRVYLCMESEGFVPEAVYLIFADSISLTDLELGVARLTKKP